MGRKELGSGLAQRLCVMVALWSRFRDSKSGVGQIGPRVLVWIIILILGRKSGAGQIRSAGGDRWDLRWHWHWGESRRGWGALIQGGPGWVLRKVLARVQHLRAWLCCRGGSHHT